MRRRSAAWALLALLLAVVGIYQPAIGPTFHFDDYSLFSDPAAVAPDGPTRLLDPARTRPLAYLSFWLNFRFGERAEAFHAVNLALFLVLVALLWDVLRRVTGERAALGAAVFFALHPLAVEPVAYVFGRAGLLAAVFTLAAWRAWVLDRRWSAVGWFAAALLSKEEAAAFPVFLLGWEWLYRRRRLDRAMLRPLAVMALMTAAAAARLAYATAATPGAGAGFEAGGVTPWEYFWTQGRVVWTYLRLALVPVGLNIDRDVRLSAGPDAGSLLGWVAILALAAFAIRAARRDRGWFRRDWFWVVGGLVLLAPSSSFFPLADLAAERRMLLPLIAFAAGFGSLWARLKDRRTQAAVLLAVALAFGLLAARRATVWRDEASLWRDAAKKSPEKVRPKLQLARALAGLGADDERRRLLEDALEIAPDDPAALGEAALFELEQGGSEAAGELLEKALRVAPDDSQMWANLGAARLVAGRPVEAERALRRALALDPCCFDARNNLIFLLSRQGRTAETAPWTAARGCDFTPRQAAALEAARAGLLR